MMYHFFVVGSLLKSRCSDEIKLNANFVTSLSRSQKSSVVELQMILAEMLLHCHRGWSRLLLNSGWRRTWGVSRDHSRALLWLGICTSPLSSFLPFPLHDDTKLDLLLLPWLLPVVFVKIFIFFIFSIELEDRPLWLGLCCVEKCALLRLS
jgi:hypothetical protein